MGWNTQDFVLSADAQYNGAVDRHGNPIDNVHNLEHWANEVFPCYQSAYQVAVNPRLPKIGLPDKFRSLRRDHVVQWRITDEQALGTPVEFYQSHLQKSQHGLDRRGRDGDIYNLVDQNAGLLNRILDDALYQHLTGHKHVDSSIYESVDDHFAYLDDEMKGILKGYLTQKPRRSIFLLDIESDPSSFHWLEPGYWAIKEKLAEFDMNHIVAISGKGYHVGSEVPLYDSNGINPVMIYLMLAGGHINRATMRQMALVREGSRKTAPTPLLSQRAYQGMQRLQQYFAVNTVDRARHKMAIEGMNPWINFSDNENESVIWDLTSMLRPVNMGDFGSIGSRYGKTLDEFIVRLIRSRFVDGRNEEHFESIEDMEASRRNPGRAAWHLINHSARFPNGSRGTKNMLDGYMVSAAKHHSHDPCSIIDEDYVAHIVMSNYKDFRGCGYEVNLIIDNPQPFSINPKALARANMALKRAGKSLRDRTHLLAAIYWDKGQQIDYKFHKYPLSEHAKWFMLLSGEDYKGYIQ